MSRRTARHKTLGHGEASSHPAYEKAIKALEKLGVSKSAGMTMRVEDVRSLWRLPVRPIVADVACPLESQFVLFCRRSPSLLFPAFTLQAKVSASGASPRRGVWSRWLRHVQLRDAICGMKFWKKATKRRVQHGMTAEEWQYVVGACCWGRALLTVAERARTMQRGHQILARKPATRPGRCAGGKEAAGV